MSRTLRALALEAGASLVYMTVVESADKDLQSCVKVFRNLLNSNVFGTERLKVFTTDEKRAIAIRAGDDREEKIGQAPGGDHSSMAWARKLAEDLTALEADLKRLGIPLTAVSREEQRAREDAVDKAPPRTPHPHLIAPWLPRGAEHLFQDSGSAAGAARGRAADGPGGWPSSCPHMGGAHRDGVWQARGARAHAGGPHTHGPLHARRGPLGVGRGLLVERWP
jgi:hypothetical protein